MSQAKLDFSAYIAERTRDFAGREWVFSEIDRWLANADGPRLFIITGEPGIGKSAIAARLTQIRNLAAAHFCIGRQADTIDPLNFTRSVSHQLTQIDGFAQGILEEKGIHVEVQINVQENYGHIIGVQIENLLVEAPSASIAFNRVVLDPLKKLYASGLNRQLVILVDALDEAIQQQGLENIVDLLANSQGLPPEVRFVLTSRPDSVALRHFNQQQVPCLLLDVKQDKNLQDVREYIRRRLEISASLQEQLKKQETKLDAEILIGRMATASEGNFLYVTWLLSAIAEGVQRFDQLEALPRGLDGIYREFLLRRKAGRDIELWRKTYRLPLGMLIAAQSLLTAKQLRQFTGLSAQDVSDFLLDMRQFLDTSGYDQDKYQLFHQSLADFLNDRNKAEEFWIDPVPIHERIARYYLDHYAGHWTDCDLYGQRYLLSHLISAADWQNIDSLLADFDFSEAKITAGMAHDLIADWDRARTLDEIPATIRAAVQDMVSFLRGRSHILTQRPDLVIQEAFNASSGPLRDYVSRFLETAQRPRRPWLRRINRPPFDSCIQTIPGHAGSILAIAATSDRQKAVSGGEDRTVKVWNLVTGACIYTMRGHTGPVLVVTMTADGRKAITGSEDGTLRIWDLVDGTCLHVLEGHTHAVLTAAVTPDGQILVSGSEDKTIRLWSLLTGKCLRVLTGHVAPLIGIGVTADSAQAITVSKDKTLRAWDLRAGNYLPGQTLELKVERKPAATVSQAFTRADGTEVVRSVSHLDKPFGAAAVIADKQLAITANDKGPTLPANDFGEGWTVGVFASSDYDVSVWNLDTGACLRALKGHDQRVRSIAVTPNGQYALTGGEDLTVRFWDTTTGDCLLTLGGHTEHVSAVGLTREGQEGVTGSTGGIIKVWDLAAGSNQAKQEEAGQHQCPVSITAFTPDRRKVVTTGHAGSGYAYACPGCKSNDFKIWDLATGNCLRTHILEGGSTVALALAVTPDSRLAVASGNKDGSVQVWDLETGSCLNTFAIQPRYDIDKTSGYDVKHILVTPDSRYAVTAEIARGVVGIPVGGPDPYPKRKHGVIKVWDLATGGCQYTLEGHTETVVDAAVSPDGQYMASASYDGTILVWDLRTGHRLHTLKGQEYWVVAITPDGRHVLGAGDKNIVQVWNLATGSELLRLEGHKKRIHTLLVAPHGEQALTVSDDSTAGLWDLQTGTCLRVWEQQSRVVALTPDGKLAVTGNSGHTLSIRKLITGEEIACFFADASIESCTVSADGQHLAAGDAKGNFYLLALEDIGLEPPIVTTWRSRYKGIAFSCPYCRTWSNVVDSALGRGLPCSNCGNEVKTNPFSIEGNWHSIAGAGSATVAGSTAVLSNRRVNSLSFINVIASRLSLIFQRKWFAPTPKSPSKQRNTQESPMPEDIQREIQRLNAQPMTTPIRAVNLASVETVVSLTYYHVFTGSVAHTEVLKIAANGQKIIYPSDPGELSVALSADQPIEALPLFDLFLLPVPFNLKSEVVFYRIHNSTSTTITIRGSHVNVRQREDADPQELCAVPHKVLDDRIVIAESAFKSVIKPHRFQSPALLDIHFELDIEMPNPELDRRSQAMAATSGQLQLKAETLRKTIPVVW